jgi:hypothetical protein
MGYDQLFKTILEKLLQVFLELFFPQVAARLDFQTLSFVGKEVFANVPEGRVREADVVARLETREGEPELVLVHIEVQTEPGSDFPRRMFEHYSVLRLHHGIPVFPVVVYLRHGPSSRLAEYRERLFEQEVLLFRYQTLALARLRAEEYVEPSRESGILSRGFSPRNSVNCPMRPRPKSRSCPRPNWIAFWIAFSTRQRSTSFSSAGKTTGELGPSLKMLLAADVVRLP